MKGQCADDLLTVLTNAIAEAAGMDVSNLRTSVKTRGAAFDSPAHHHTYTLTALLI